MLWLLALVLWDAPSRSPRALLGGLLRNRRPDEIGVKIARALFGALAAFAALYLLYESLPISQLGAFSAIAIATFLAALVAASLIR